MVKSHTSNKKIDESAVIVDFGTRAVSLQNFSKIVALPKQAIANLGQNIERVNVELVQTEAEKYIKLTPSGAGKQT